MKRSSRDSGFADLVEAFRWSAEEVAALDRAARHRPLSLEEYLDFCSQFPDATREELERRPGPRGKRFTLPKSETGG